MKVSVIIPAYNAQETVERCVQSVMQQSLSDDIEIIVVNDGSLDKTIKVLESFVESKITKNRCIRLFNQENKGVSVARNNGINFSSGDYIAFLDADDYWHPRKLEIILSMMIEHDFAIMGHAFTLSNNFNESFDLFKLSNHLRRVTFNEQLLKNFAVTPSIVVRRDAFLLFDPDLSYAEDHEMLARMALKHQLVYLDIPLVVLDRPPLTMGGLSASRIRMRLGEVKMYLSLAKYSTKVMLGLPIFIVFSLLKHIRREMIILKDKVLSKYYGEK